MRAMRSRSIPATRAARMVSAPSASTWTISASMPAKPSPSRGRATMFSGRIPSMTGVPAASGGQRAAGSSTIASPSLTARPPRSPVAHAGSRFIGGLPRNAATKVLAGRR